ncbi:hypothetical protein K501DRAFT_220372 [Backusella circina FSU 941]|nr:hypothetical protein K501DRAFT_220372 [Backusella circina FSU 941]
MKAQRRKSKSRNVPRYHRFRLSSTSGHILPLQTIRQRVSGIWKSLTWPMCVKIIKANIAVTIALGLLFVDSIRELTGTGIILASVAVEFVHPAKSYGFIAEDVLLGSVMCCVSASWAILGSYLASLVRNPNDPEMAQPKVCAILASFLVFGSFCLNLFRVKVEQANVGGMLSATIMVISLTTAVTKEFSPNNTLQVLVPTLVGFFIIFMIFFLVFPENSTKVYMQQLIKSLETFDKITAVQIDSFLRENSGSPMEVTNKSLAEINNTVDILISALIQKKRMVRREPSYNTVAPTDISEMTSLIKKMRVPIQGIGLSRAMEENMRNAEKDVLEKVKIDNDINGRPRSYYGGTDDEEEEEDGSLSEEDMSGGGAVTPSGSFASTNELTVTSRTRRRNLLWDDSVKILSYWREDYDDILEFIKPIYLELSYACSVTMSETVKRLRRLQGLDPRYQDKPFFYKYYYRFKNGKNKVEEESAQYIYDRKVDPSTYLYKAMRKFHEHRLNGLERLYTKSGVPRRILFLLLTFQFNLHLYAETLYTLASLVYEIDCARDKKKFWLPHINLTQWLFKSQTTDDVFDIDTPVAIAETTNPLSLQRSLTRRATLIHHAADIEAQPQCTIYRLETPHRGKVHTPTEHHTFHPYDYGENPSKFVNPWRQNTLDPLDYHDPDVAYPTTRTQYFFFKVYLFMMRNLYTADVAFSIRAAVIVAALSLPGFLPESIEWYNEARGQWAVVVALIWMGPSVGSNFFGTMTRTLGTFIGAAQSIIIWEASRATEWGLLVLTFIFNLPWWMVYINGKFWKATGLFSLITVSLIIGYSYYYLETNQPISVYRVTYERTVDVLVGVLAALFISVFPFPRTGRVVLRHRIAQTLSELGALYSSFLALLLKNEPESVCIQRANRKLFRCVASSIRRQIKGERVLLEQSRFEPALRGVFPEDKYVAILQILENILNLMLEMEQALAKIPHEWRMTIVSNTWKERKVMISSYLNALHLGSNALTSKAPLPPYTVRPTKARRDLTNQARQQAVMKMSHLGDREYTYFSTYLMNSEQLAVEIELLIANIRDLVGPDSVSVWLNYKH